mmetsp:Transcript_44580/g.102952  ORF Transcript_44580/g.102952 Transcript_44580/m.102952 type:complete len:97 (+) Transcript_44580:1773-2063(+)
MMSASRRRQDLLFRKKDCRKLANGVDSCVRGVWPMGVDSSMAVLFSSRASKRLLHEGLRLRCRMAADGSRSIAKKQAELTLREYASAGAQLGLHQM